MFCFSLSRVGRVSLAISVPATVAGSRAITAAAAAVTASSRPFSCCRHQRRHSSSKQPPVPPNDDSRGMEAPNAPAKATARSAKACAEKPSSTKMSRSKGKNASRRGQAREKDRLFASLPTVPSTHHVHPNDIHIASFFSIHRPLSVTSSVPQNTTASAFASIFEHRLQNPSKPHISDVIFTLSTAGQHLESAIQNYSQAHAGSSNTAIIPPSINNSESPPLQPESPPINLDLEEISKQFRPFHPPPVPEPMPDEPFLNETVDLEPKHKSYSTILTIHESTYANGERTYEAHTTPIFETSKPVKSAVTHHGSLVWRDPPLDMKPKTFLGRMRLRQLRQERKWSEEAEGQDEGRELVWKALSVKRQRKLKMKKHKYKKLRKRTRNLKRRLDRL